MDHLSGYKERFRCCFATERKRQWEVREALKAINHKLAFVTFDNAAAAGRFMEEIFCAKRHDATTIQNNIDDLDDKIFFDIIFKHQYKII